MHTATRTQRHKQTNRDTWPNAERRSSTTSQDWPEEAKPTPAPATISRTASARNTRRVQTTEVGDDLLVQVHPTLLLGRPAHPHIGRPAPHQAPPGTRLFTVQEAARNKKKTASRIIPIGSRTHERNQPPTFPQQPPPVVCYRVCTPARGVAVCNQPGGHETATEPVRERFGFRAYTTNRGGTVAPNKTCLHSPEADQSESCLHAVHRPSSHWRSHTQTPAIGAYQRDRVFRVLENTDNRGKQEQSQKGGQHTAQNNRTDSVFCVCLCVTAQVCV